MHIEIDGSVQPRVPILSLFLCVRANGEKGLNSPGFCFNKLQRTAARAWEGGAGANRTQMETTLGGGREAESTNDESKNESERSHTESPFVHLFVRFVLLPVVVTFTRLFLGRLLRGMPPERRQGAAGRRLHHTTLLSSTVLYTHTHGHTHAQITPSTPTHPHPNHDARPPLLAAAPDAAAVLSTGATAMRAWRPFLYASYSAEPSKPERNKASSAWGRSWVVWVVIVVNGVGVERAGAGSPID